MSERTAILILVIGVVLVVAAVVGISAVALSQGLVTLPADGLGSTPYTLTGYLVGYVLILAAVGTVAVMVRRRTPKLPARQSTSPQLTAAGRAFTRGQASVPGGDVEAATTQFSACAIPHAQLIALPVIRSRPERRGATYLAGDERRRVYRSRSAVNVRRSGPADVPAGRRLSALATVAVAAVLLAGIAQLLTGGLW